MYTQSKIYTYIYVLMKTSIVYSLDFYCNTVIMKHCLEDPVKNGTCLTKVRLRKEAKTEEFAV